MAGPLTAGLRGAASGSLNGVSSSAIYGGNIGQGAWQGAAYGAGTAELFWAKNTHTTEKFLNNNVKWDSSVGSADKAKYVQAIREGGQSPVGQKMMGEYRQSGNSLTIHTEPLDSNGLANAHGWAGNISLNSNIDAYRAVSAHVHPGNQMKTIDLATIMMHEMGHGLPSGAMTDPSNVTYHENPYRSWIGSPARSMYSDLSVPRR